MMFSLEDQFRGFLATPQIFAENAIFEYPQFPTSVEEINPILLKHLTEPPTLVLGKRMEHFFSYYIGHLTSREVLLHNKQIISEKETLGELDFLLKDPISQEISHIELIYKFYLFDPDTGTSEKEHFIGPNKRDSLNLKLERLQKRQFPLLFLPATQKLLQQLKVSPEEVVQKMCFKASVFLPKQWKVEEFSEINPDTISGYWIKAAKFTSEEYAGNSFFTPKKKYWPVNPELNKTWYSFDEILKQINPLLEKKFAPLLWMKTSGGTFERFFVIWW